MSSTSIIRSPSDTNWPAGKIPYPGLRPFTAEWSTVFSGRDREIENVLEHVELHWSRRQDPLIVLVGPAGSGLSSLLRAGILPHLNDRAIVLPVLRPGVNPLRALALAMSRAIGREAEAGAWMRTLETSSQETLKSAFEAFSRDLATCHARPGAKIVLAIDQINDLLLAAPSPEVEAFERAIKVARISAAAITIILPMRFEDLDLFQRRLMAQPGFEVISVSPIRDDAIEEIIRKPLDRAGFQIEDELVTALLADARHFERAEVPARLSFVMLKLCEASADEKVLCLSSYSDWAKLADHGNPLDAPIARLAESAFDRASPNAGESEAWRQLLATSLILLDQHKNPVRRLTRLYRLLIDAEPLAVEMLACGFISRYSADDGEYVEIASHILFSAWPRLQAAVDVLRNEPLLIVSHREVTAETQSYTHRSREPSSGNRQSSGPNPVRKTAQRSAVALLVFAAGIGFGSDKPGKLGSARLNGRASIETPAPQEPVNVRWLAEHASQNTGTGPAKSRAATWARASMLLAANTAQSPAAEQPVSSMPRVPAAFPGAQVEHDLELRLKAAEAAAKEANQALSTLRVSYEASQKTIQELDQRLRDMQVAADSQTEKLKLELDRERELRTAAERASADAQIAAFRAVQEADRRIIQGLENRLRETQTVAAHAETLKQDLAHERALREAAEQSAAASVDLRTPRPASHADWPQEQGASDAEQRADQKPYGEAGPGAKPSEFGKLKAERIPKRRWWRRARSTDHAKVAEFRNFSQSAGWKAISPMRRAAGREVGTLARYSTYARSPRE